MAKQEAVEAEIGRMIKMGVIERSNSPYSIPIVPIFKKATFLGHVITTEGVKMDEEKNSTIRKFNEPKNKKGLQSFIRFLNVYRRYMDKFTHTTESLMELLRNDKNGYGEKIQKYILKYIRYNRDNLYNKDIMSIKEIV